VVVALKIGLDRLRFIFDPLPPIIPLWRPPYHVNVIIGLFQLVCIYCIIICFFYCTVALCVIVILLLTR